MKAGDLAMEVTVISADDLETPSFVFGRRLRPFVVLFAAATLDCDRLPPLLHSTRVADDSDAPAWGEQLRVPLEPSFLLSHRGGVGDDDEAGVYLVVLSKRPFGGAARLGWCRVPPADVLDSFRHPSSLRRLSYALRHPRHGGRCRGVIHLAARLVGRDVDRLLPPPSAPQPLPLPSSQPRWGGVAIGIPVSDFGPPPRWAAGGGSGGVENVGFVEGRMGFDIGFDFRLNYQPI